MTRSIIYEPVTDAEPSVEGLERYAEFLESSASLGDGRRLVVTVSSQDGARLLRTTLRVLDDPKLLQNVRLTIDGSVTAATGGHATLSFIVKPVTTAARDKGLTDGQVQHLRTRIHGELVKALPEQPLLKVAVEPLRTSGSSRLFAGTHLGEVRLGLPGLSKTSWPSACGSMLQEVSALLGNQGIPIAYALGPFRWRSGPSAAGMDRDEIEATRWLRVGYGLPGSWANDFLVGLDIAGIAEDRGWHFAVYSPTSNSKSDGMGTRFAIDLRSDAETRDHGAPSTELNRPRFFLASTTRDAASGLVSRLVNTSQPGSMGQIASVSMAALHGKTILSVVATEAIAKQVADEIVDLQPSELDATGLESFWLSWRCADRPGVARRLLDALTSDLPEGASDLDLSVEYAVTRVIEDGETCAGKIRFCGTRAVVEALLQQRTQLIGRLRAVVRSELKDWNPPHSEWKNEPLRISTEEPWEEPWATLALRAGIGL